MPIRQYKRARHQVANKRENQLPDFFCVVRRLAMDASLTVMTVLSLCDPLTMIISIFEGILIGLSSCLYIGHMADSEFMGL